MAQGDLMKILLADDHELVRDAIAAILRGEADFTVDVVSTLNAALERTGKGAEFDIILLDYTMPGMNGLEGLAAMKARQPNIPVAILSGTASNAVGEAALTAGAAGFLPKTMATRTLISAIRHMAAGEIFTPVAMVSARETPGRQLAGAQLTQRETEVLRLLCLGKSNKEIGRDLDLQEVTVKLHVKTLCRKIEARNRTHAAMIASEAGIF